MVHCLKMIRLHSRMRHAREMGTWALSRLSSVSSGRVQPVLDMDYVLGNLPLIEDSIRKRNVPVPPDLSRLPKLYEDALSLRDAKQEAQEKRETHSREMVNVYRDRHPVNDSDAEIIALKEKGKILRDNLRAATASFNKINDAIIDLVISLPNVLDKATPVGSNQLLKTVPVPADVKPWSTPTDLEWSVVPGVGPIAEYPKSKASLLELDLSALAQSYLLKHKFSETGNVDFVKSSLFELSGIDSNQFIKIRESNINPVPETHASYLVGGASFPAFLALFAQSVIKNPDEVMPIRYFVIGRSYGKNKKGDSFYQRSAVQVFVACRSEEEMEKEFQEVSTVTENFLARSIGIPFTMELTAAPFMLPYERKQIVFQSSDGYNKQLSSVTAVGDYVSKRLLCCFSGSSPKHAKFMHLVTGRFLNLTDFIRPPEKTLGKVSNSTAS